MLELGWQHVGASVGLISWSKLATWDADNLQFQPAAEDDFERSVSGHNAVHKQFGRLICWIVFAVGGEYLVKGVCLLNGKVPKLIPVLRLPSPGDDIERWILAVKSKTASKENVPSLDALGKSNEYLRSHLTLPDAVKDFVYASIDLLRESIRNRDVHRYALDERAVHFHAVPNLFVPTFNILLNTLDQESLRKACQNPEA